MANFTEIIWLGILVVGTVLSARLKTRTWLLVDAVLAFFFVFATLPFSKEAQETETKGVAVDIHHASLAQLYLGHCLMPSIAWLFVRDSASPTFEFAILCSRIVSTGLGVIVMGVDHFRLEFFTPMHLYYAVLGSAAWLLISAVQLYKGDYLNQKGLLLAKPSKLDFFLKFDVAWNAVLYALPDLFAPWIIFYIGQFTADPLHTHLLRTGSTMNYGTLTLSFLALYFKNDKEKQAVLLGRILYMLLLWGARTYTYMTSTDTFFDYFFFSLAFVPIFPAYVGFRQEQTSK